MKRVMIVGGPGSGKTSLALRLSEKTNLPVYHTDMIVLGPNWEKRKRKEKSRLAHQIEACDAWIIEGVLPITLKNRLARADTCIWLDIGFATRFARILKRGFKFKGQARPGLPDGCIESYNLQFLGFLNWVWTRRNSSRLSLVRHLAGPSNAAILRMRSLSDVERFLDTIPDDES